MSNIDPDKANTKGGSHYNQYTTVEVKNGLRTKVDGVREFEIARIKFAAHT